MNPLNLIPNWMLAVMVTVSVATSCKLTVDLGAVKLELEKTKVVHEQERATQMAVLAQAQQRFRESEQNLVEATVAIREETHAQIAANTAAADDLRRRLRIAQANAATAALVSSATQVAPAEPPGTVDAGAQLSERVGSDLVSLAERGDTLRAELQACYRTYEAARSGLEALSK